MTIAGKFRRAKRKLGGSEKNIEWASCYPCVPIFPQETTFSRLSNRLTAHGLRRYRNHLKSNDYSLLQDKVLLTSMTVFFVHGGFPAKSSLIG